MKKLLLLTFTIIFPLLFTACSKKEQETKFYGNVDLRTVSLGFRVPGKVKEVFFDEGQKIKKGDVLAKLNDDLYIQALNGINAQVLMQEAQIEKLENGYRKEDIAKAKASLDKALVTLKKAKKDLHRYEKLLSTNSVSKQNYDDIKLVFDNAKAQYDYAKSNLTELENGYLKEDISMAKASLQSLLAQKEEAKIHLEDTTLYAPNDGVVLTRAYEVGSIISQGAPIFEVALNKEYWVRSYIDEKYLGLIKPGMKAKVFTDSKADSPYEATLSFISAQAEFTPKNVQTEQLRTQLVYRIRLIIKNPDEYIRQGMPVTIKFENLD
ncbi:MAG: HlyD family efflux transporter periplasmic adaptor subunit [Halarcobacter sp.]